MIFLNSVETKRDVAWLNRVGVHKPSDRGEEPSILSSFRDDLPRKCGWVKEARSSCGQQWIQPSGAGETQWLTLHTSGRQAR